MPGKSFRRRLLLAFGGLVLLGVAIPFLYFSLSMGNALLTEAEERARLSLDLVEWLLKEQAPFSTEQELDQWITALGKRMGVRITCIAAGRVVADSQVRYPGVERMDDHSERPEVRMAMEQGAGMSRRLSATLGRELVYVAKRTEVGFAQGQGVLRLALPNSGVRDKQRRMMSLLLWSLPVTLIITVLFSLLFSRSLSRSIRSFSATARSIGQGSYQDRLRVFPGSEFQPLAEAVNTMAGDIAAQIERLTDQKGQLEALFNGLSEGVLILDSRGRIESWNRALETMVEGVEACKGRKPLEAFMDTRLQRSVERVLAEAESAQMEYYERQGREMEISLEPFLDEGGVRKLVMVIRDVTEMRRLERVRRDFVANVSHEMRTPLTNIMGYAETLLDQGAGSPTEERFLGVIRNNAKKLVTTVENLMHLSRLEQMGGEMDLEQVNAGSALNEARSASRLLMDEKGLKVEVDFPKEQLLVMADRNYLETVLRNLIDNAVRYSPPRGVVRISAVTENNRVVFCVADQGPGIPRAEQGKIFERFYRSPDQDAKGKGDGSGLGLAICRHALKVMGGRIWVEEPGSDEQGARLCFSLALA